MKNVWEQGAVSTPPTAPSTPSVGWPTDGVLGSQPPTIPGAYLFYMLVAELMNLVIGAGLTPNASDVTQVFTAVETIVNTAVSGLQTTIAGWFTGTNQSYTANGYQKLPGGGIWNWTSQSISAGDTDVTVTYAAPFTTFSAVPVPSVVDPSVSGGNESNFLGLSVISYSLTGCVIGLGQNGGGTRTVTLAVTCVGK